MIHFLLLLLLSSCAFQQGRYETDRYSAVYHGGGNRVVIPMLGRRLKNYLSEDTDSELDQAASSPAEAAVAGVVLSGLSLAFNRKYYESPFLSGRVLCRVFTNESFDVPCSNVVVRLKELGSLQERTILSSDGEFVFHVDSGKEYFVFADSTHFRQVTHFERPLQMGDNVVIYLEAVPVPKSELKIGKVHSNHLRHVSLP